MKKNIRLAKKFQSSIHLIRMQIVLCYFCNKIWDIVRHTLNFYVDGLFDFQEEEDEEEEFELKDEEEEEVELENDEEDEYEEANENEIQQEEDSEYEWVYEDDAQLEEFDEGSNIDEDKNFVQDNTNEGEYKFKYGQKNIRKKQTQQQQQQKRVIQQAKSKSSIPNGIPTLQKIQNKQRANSQSKQQIQKPQPQQQNLLKQAAVNQLRFPSSLVNKK
ncbi:unnamed protein product [Paramecium sonneborni]|uniref:Uncharacterized protein n=1 Tax=Paramecium sonneborni TaxID=65129 RepID=A0A8S1RLN5_9CILI|nr:unnamed protein product [Paramecium sonneborni]